MPEHARSGTGLHLGPVDIGALVRDVATSLTKRAHGDDVGGSGIGLAVCRKIVEAHGGAIWAEAAEDGGTVMRLTVPA